MKFRIRHYTEYSYPDPASTCYNRLCLTPIDTREHRCSSSEISIVPRPDELANRIDFFGNKLVFFSVFKEHVRLRVNSNSLVEVDKIDHVSLSARANTGWKDVLARFEGPSDISHEYLQYRLSSTHVPHSDEARAFAMECFESNVTLWDACSALMNKIFTAIEFKPGFTTVNTPVDAVLKHKKGVCQDFAHLMIASLRSLGFAARYVSGYIETLPPPGKPRMVGADASHAWVSVYFPDVGWVEFDPTNKLMPSDMHIRVAYGRDYFDVAPLKGIVFNSGKQNLVVKVDVERQLV
jgi:transglutaminase-like putative cysteine protease